MSSTIQIATRKSPLAIRQTDFVVDWLREKLPEETFEQLPLSTKIDERLNWSLEKRGGLGLFTKELEEALLDGRATLAVHSAKDLPTTLTDGLHIAGYLPRANPRDVLVKRLDCEKPAVIASSSPRRRAQLSELYPEAEWTTIRGNVATRLRKIAEGEADASLLAAAGLERLEISGHEGLEFIELPIEQCVPAPGQAAIAIQCAALRQSLHDPDREAEKDAVNAFLGFCAGIICDGQITSDEARAIHARFHADPALADAPIFAQLRWGVDKALADAVLDAEEAEEIRDWIAALVTDGHADTGITNIGGVLAPTDPITDVSAFDIAGKVFVLTGKMSMGPRSLIGDEIARHGGASSPRLPVHRRPATGTARCGLRL